MKPPVTKRVLSKTTVHGKTMRDYYDWIRGGSYRQADIKDVKNDPPEEATDYIAKENAYTKAFIDAHLKNTTTEIEAEMKSRIAGTDSSVPVLSEDGYYYYSRYEDGKDYRIHCRKKSLDSDEEIVLDENALASKEEHFTLGNYSPGFDGTKLLYSACYDGSETYQVFIKDLSTGTTKEVEFSDKKTRVNGGLPWHLTGKGFYYQPVTEGWRTRSVFYYDLEANTQTELYKEEDDTCHIGAGLTNNNQYLIIGTGTGEESGVMVFDNTKPGVPKKALEFKREEGKRYEIDHHEGDIFYLKVNDTGPNGRIVKYDASTKKMTDLVAHKKGHLISDFTVFKDHLVYTDTNNGREELKIIQLSTGKVVSVDFPEDSYTLGGGGGLFDGDTIRLSYQSFVTPPITYDCELKTGELTKLKQKEIPNVDLSKYKQVHVEIKADDGEMIPVNLIAPADADLSGKVKHPLHITGYGSYGMDYAPYFASRFLSLVDRGVIFGIAQIRGGSDKGREWYEAAKFETKARTFHDFRDVLKGLQKTWATPELTSIEGRSAGGMLMGYMVNNYPELFKVNIAGVPFVDCVNTILDEKLPLTPGEFKEWGNPITSAKIFHAMLSYCPYQNVEDMEFPSLFISGGLNDPRVTYWEMTKWTAKMRHHQQGGNPLLLMMKGVGHFGDSGRYSHLYDKALEYAFILHQFNMIKAKTPKAKATKSKSKKPKGKTKKSKKGKGKSKKSKKPRKRTTKSKHQKSRKKR